MGAISDSADLIVSLSVVGDRPTGLATYALNVAPHLAVQNTLLLASLEAQHQISKTQTRDISYYEIPSGMSAEHGKAGHFRRLRWTQTQLPKIYQVLKANLVFSPLPEAPIWNPCRSVVMVHDLIPLRFPNWRSPLTIYAKYYVPLVLNQALHIVCNSQATADDIVAFYHISADKITPIPLAYNADHFRLLDLPTSNYFVYLGRQDPYKNLHRVLDAFAALPRCQDYELWLVGSTDPRFAPDLSTHAEALGIAAQVKFLDYVPYTDLPEVLNRAIALLFPSLWEGFGFPVLEAMACGTPVITSNRSSMPEVAGDAALLVNPEDTGAIAHAMQRLVTEPDVRSHLRTAGLARARQFSWEKTGATTRALLSQFL
ncbi:glycosyltransferase family 1 protein [Thermoleptolyngbya sp. PKUAC-SCTB121]|uniref:glycosyltransferase family 4 protein n=1 Tax=Thermoleptolyngbya sp. PKUAC-SCTB121 TaxID=2811482 RepID=UPI001962D9CB|nr:glycosyltransferase family 1 protein [Thermoleptolyngbya sp. PKUAC-SCTB121]